jgi:hypothetical protein
MDCADARPLISRHLDGELPDRSARALADHLTGCPACRRAERALTTEHRALARHWAAAAASPGFAARVAAGLPPRRGHPLAAAHRRRPAAVAAVVAALAVLTTAALATPVGANLGLFLRHVLLRDQASLDSPGITVPVPAVSLQEAQRRVPWRIRLPGDLPEGYRLHTVAAGALHEAADGPTILLHYQNGEGAAARSLYIMQFQARQRVEEPVAPGASRSIDVGGRMGLLIDGLWEQRDGRWTWSTGTLLRLIVEDGDLVIQLQADPRDGWDAGQLTAVAASLR